jgi:tetratricopeptide (TPR) repeat protein
MKRFVLSAGLLLAVMLAQAQAQQDPDDQYVIIYSLMQQADAHENSGEPQQALPQYVEAQAELQKFQKLFPDWYTNIVAFRLNYLAQKIVEASAKVPATNVVVQTNAIPATQNDLEAQLSALHDQVQTLQADNTTLEAKLKEALASQPAMIDARELAKAQAQIESLMKENDLLRTSLAQGKTNGVAQSLEQVQQQLAEAMQKLAGQTARADKLAMENQSLQAKVQSLQTGANDAEALREENQVLKKQIADLKSGATASFAISDTSQELARARTQIARLQSEAEVNWLEKSALENRVQQLQSQTMTATQPPPSASPDQAEYEKRIQALTQERDDLLEKLGEANKKIYGNKGQNAAAQIDELGREVETLRARISVDEAQVIPYTPEELALFKQPSPQLANPEAATKSVRELPIDTAALAAEAQNYFSERQFDKAEADYLQILQRDKNNALALANLSAIELELNKLDDAEKYIRAALAQNPNDAYDLSILGHLQFLQGKYDDALDTLGRAAKIDSQNAEIQNYLGVTLAQKGLRAQAETALRKAVQIDPNYGPAHNNLAVIYLNQQPPLVELARWHYEKALAVGQPHNPDLEKALNDKGAPVDSQ